MASISYEMVKNWIKEHQGTQFDFPIACIFDFSNIKEEEEEETDQEEQ